VEFDFVVTSLLSFIKLPYAPPAISLIYSEHPLLSAASHQKSHPPRRLPARLTHEQRGKARRGLTYGMMKDEAIYVGIVEAVPLIMVVDGSTIVKLGGLPLMRFNYKR
jgi:hypothetical protein